MKRGRGFSLAEVMVGLALLGIFTLLVHQGIVALLRGVRVLEAASEAQEAARLGVELIAADLREAGFSPGGVLGNGLTRAGRDVVAVARDLNGDGDLDDPNERVAYRYDASRSALTRSQGDAPPQPLLDDVDDGGFTVAYLTADGSSLSPGDGELDAAQRALVRRVALRLVIAIRRADPALPRPPRAEQTTTVALRNPQR